MSKQLLDKFTAFYEKYESSDLARLQEIYSSDVIFRDPLHELQGLEKLTTYFHHNTSNLKSCRFEFVETAYNENDGYIIWNMKYSHSKLAGGRRLSLRGVTHIRWDEKIFYHEDMYDMGAMVYEHVPVIGRSVRWLKNRLVA